MNFFFKYSMHFLFSYYRMIKKQLNTISNIKLSSSANCHIRTDDQGLINLISFLYLPKLSASEVKSKLNFNAFFGFSRKFAKFSISFDMPWLSVVERKDISSRLWYAKIMKIHDQYRLKMALAGVSFLRTSVPRC